MGRHHLTLYYTSRRGSWAVCSCGWRARYSYTTVTGAHLSFGLHLVGKPEPVWRWAR